MTDEKYFLSREKLEALLASLSDERPTDGDHASDDTLMEYAMELLPTDQLASLQRHLASCADCAAPAQKLLELAKPWRGQAGQERLAAFSARLLGALPSIGVEAADSTLTDALRTFLQPITDGLSALWVGFVSSAPRAVGTAYASSEPEIVTRHSDEGNFGFFAEVNPETGALEMRMDSRDVRLEGWKLIVSGGDWSRMGHFQRVPGDRVGAEIIVPAAERGQVPPGKQLRIAVVPETEPKR